MLGIGELRREVAELRASINGLAESHTMLASMNERLVDIVAEMRREGFEAPPQPTAPLEGGPNLDAEVEDTIQGLAKPGTSLYRELVSDAAGMQAANVGAEKIIQRLKQGGDPRDWEGF